MLSRTGVPPGSRHERGFAPTCATIASTIDPTALHGRERELAWIRALRHPGTQIRSRTQDQRRARHPRRPRLAARLLRTHPPVAGRAAPGAPVCRTQPCPLGLRPGKPSPTVGAKHSPIPNASPLHLPGEGVRPGRSALPRRRGSTRRPTCPRRRVQCRAGNDRWPARASPRTAAAHPETGTAKPRWRSGIHARGSRRRRAPGRPESRRATGWRSTTGRFPVGGAAVTT